MPKSRGTPRGDREGHPGDRGGNPGRGTGGNPGGKGGNPGGTEEGIQGGQGRKSRGQRREGGKVAKPVAHQLDVPTEVL